MVDERASQAERTPTGDATIRSRVDELVAQMTPAEKAGQLTQYFYFGSVPDSTTETRRRTSDRQPVGRSRGGLAPRRGGSLLFVTDPAETNRLQRLAIEGNRLGIPVLFGFDVIHGLRTIFPVPIAMAASWDLEHHRAEVSRSPPAKRGQWASTGRSRRWWTLPGILAGVESIEGAGEDPYLGAAVAVAQVRGFQGARCR